jgi:hypothetical protein
MSQAKEMLWGICSCFSAVSGAPIPENRVPIFILFFLLVVSV